MNFKKTFERIKLVLVNILKQVLNQILMLVLSVFIFKFYSKELWGEFSTYFIYINLISIATSWGNKEFLIREFSKAPGKIADNFYLIFNSRLVLLALGIIAAVIVFPTKSFWFFGLWISSLYVSQSLEVFWIYKRDYIKSIGVEILSFSMLLLFLFYNQITSDVLVEYYAYYQLTRTVLYILIYYSDLKKIHFGYDKKYFFTAISFFLLTLVGFLQSRADFVIITFFESDKNIAIYQIITAFFILIHALGTFLIFPYMKNIYRLQKQSVHIFQRFISLVSPLIVCFCLAVLFLITKYIYKIELDYQYYLLGFAITFPPYLYTVKILILYKENKQDFVLRTGLIAIVINSMVSILLLYFGYGLKGALLGSAVAHLFTAYRYLSHFSNQKDILNAG
jgi:O-antigen/teichoic acid export membrane protein